MSTRRLFDPDPADKPQKPHPEYPLFAHNNGCWCKKIRGRLHYFGVWVHAGPDYGADAALAKYLAEKDALHAGRSPRPDPKDLTVKDVANAFLNAKREAVDAGELALRTWKDYRAIMDMMVEGFGKHKPVAALDPQDFAVLKNQLSRRNGPARMSTVVQVIRCAFKHVYESGLLDRPMRFGPVFKRTSKKTLRVHRAKQGAKLFTAEEIHRLLSAAGVHVRAMILLAINCGFGNQDVAALPQAALDLEAGWVSFPRPKTGIDRRCPLWPETVRAITESLAQRPEPKETEAGPLLFVTKYGQAWAKADNAGPLTQQMGKLLKRLSINGRKGLGFYTLRHTFRTVADEAKDQPACDFLMGHESPHISSVYRERISDARLKAVTDHVRAWLFAETKVERPATDLTSESPN